MADVLASRKHTLAAHSAALYALAPGRTNDSLFTAGADRVVAEWNTTTGSTNAFGVRTDATVYSLLNIQNRVLLIGTSAGSMHVVDLHNNQELRHLKYHSKGIFHMAYLHRLNRVYAACADGSISIWEASQWSLLWHLPLCVGKVRRIAFDAQEALVAVACGDGTIHVMETEHNRLIYRWQAHEDSANCLAFLPNGDLLSGGKDAHLKRWAKADGYRLHQEIPAHNYALYDIVVHPEGKWIATASRDKMVKIWDLALADKPLRLDRKDHQGHTHSVNALLYLADQNLLVSAGDDRSAVVWQIGSTP